MKFATCFAALLASAVALSAAPSMAKERSGRLLQSNETRIASAGRLDGLIAKHARANGVPLALAHAVITVESRYNPNVRGSAGEIGLMQIKPATARGVGYGGSTKGLFDPDTNLTYGMRYLAQARQLAGGDICGTILRYNAGHGAKRMNKTSAAYCSKVKSIMASNSKKGGLLQFASN